MSLTHSFAICAYGQSSYLEECIRSVLAQEGSTSEVFIATSTPSEWLSAVAERYDLPIYVNTGEHGIGQDWNFALSKASGQYVTLAHQDDVYLPSYARVALEYLCRSSTSLIFFCNYGEIRRGEACDQSRLLSIKRSLLRPLAGGSFASSKWMRRRILSIGSAICCPSVTLNMNVCPTQPFRLNMKSNLDWDAWEQLSRMDGEFWYDSRILMRHRISEESATSALIEDGTRAQEDYEMIKRFWPQPLASLMYRVYAKGMDSNTL